MGKKVLAILKKMYFRRYMIAKYDNEHNNLSVDEQFRLKYEMYEIKDLIEEYKERIEEKKKLLNNFK